MSRIDVKCSDEILKDFIAVLPGQFQIKTLRHDSSVGIYDITLEAPADLAPGLYTCQFEIRSTGFSMDFVPAQLFTGTGTDKTDGATA